MKDHTISLMLKSHYSSLKSKWINLLYIMSDIFKLIHQFDVDTQRWHVVFWNWFVYIYIKVFVWNWKGYSIGAVCVLYVCLYESNEKPLCEVNNRVASKWGTTTTRKKEIILFDINVVRRQKNSDHLLLIKFRLVERMNRCCKFCEIFIWFACKSATLNYLFVLFPNPSELMDSFKDDRYFSLPLHKRWYHTFCLLYSLPVLVYLLRGGFFIWYREFCKRHTSQ